MFQRHFHKESDFVPYEILRHNSSRWKDRLRDVHCRELNFNESEELSICMPIESFVQSGVGQWFWDTFEVYGYNKVIISLLFAIILVLAVVGNILIMVTVLLNKVMWTTMHVFIVSLAVSDTFVSITCIPLNIVRIAKTEWIFGNMTCQLMTFLMQFSITASTLTLCCMAAERYIAIVHPLRFGSLKTVQRAIVVLIIVWLLSVASGSPYLYYSKVIQLPCGSAKSCKEGIVFRMCAFKEGSREASMFLHWLNFAVCFVVPIAVLLITYSIIVYKLWIKAPVGIVTISVSGIRNRYKKKAIKMLLLVVLLFLICWTPVVILDIVLLRHNFRISGLANLKFYLQCLAFSSTALNPLVYAFMNHKFRASFVALLTRRFRRVAPLDTPCQQLQKSAEACNKSGALSESPHSKSMLCSLGATKSSQV